jgi:hypothetical protein
MAKMNNTMQFVLGFIAGFAFIMLLGLGICIVSGIAYGTGAFGIILSICAPFGIIAGIFAGFGFAILHDN